MKRCLSCGSISQIEGSDTCVRCSGILVEIEPDDLVDGRYALLEEIGRGGVGTVFRARDVYLERSVALKLIQHPSASAQQGFRTEAVALARLRHDHVVQVYAFGPHRNKFYMAMEHVRGVSLAQVLAEHRERGATIPLSRVATILRSIADGLGAAHAEGIVHRDVKPANIVIEERTGRPVLIDFGLAQTADGPGRSSGTVGYMSPEQLRGEPSTARSDLYALGCVAFELLTGRPPFDGSGEDLVAAHLGLAPPSVSSMAPAAGQFDELCRRALEKDPDARWQDAEAFLAAIDAAEQSPEPPRALEGTDPDAAPVESLYVLVVDDDPVFRRMATRAAQLAFYRRPVRVKMVESGEEAIAVAERRMPDLVLLDYSLPGMSGLDTLTEIRALEQSTDTRVIVVSASLSNVERWRFGVLGVNDFIGKPVGLTDLTTALTEIASTSWFAQLPEAELSRSSSSATGDPEGEKSG